MKKLAEKILSEAKKGKLGVVWSDVGGTVFKTNSVKSHKEHIWYEGKIIRDGSQFHARVVRHTQDPGKKFTNEAIFKKECESLDDAKAVVLKQLKIITQRS
jgi:hypothetical protein